ncbi:hypothetical protein BGZ50_001056 [Haplosporangium sp. Z 11]|nr:hypothetical protein BGZ50_001056 [Haplosporangium sp. Z 11]
MKEQLRIIQKLQLSKGIKNTAADERIRCLDEFSTQISLLQQHRTQLLDRLNRPRLGEHILMDHQYHKDFVGLFQKIQQEIPKAKQNMEAMTWIHGFLGSTADMENMKRNLDDLTELFRKQTEMADVSLRLQSNLSKVLQSSQALKNK